jgi:hypothetical protein
VALFQISKPLAIGTPRSHIASWMKNRQQVGASNFEQAIFS